MKLLILLIIINLIFSLIAENKEIEVSLTTKDDTIIKGNYYPNSDENAHMVLLFHMFGRNSGDWKQIIYELNNYFSVLAIDFRGHGNSRFQKGYLLDYRDFDAAKWLTLKEDAEAAYSYLEKIRNNEETKIGIIGASIGANIAAYLGSQYDNIKAIVLLSPGLNYQGIDILPFIKLSKANILIIVSEKDEYSYKSSMEIYKIYKDKIQLKIYPGAFHGTRIISRYPDSKDIIISWLKERL